MMGAIGRGQAALNYLLKQNDKKWQTIKGGLEALEIKLSNYKKYRGTRKEATHWDGFQKECAQFFGQIGAKLKSYVDEAAKGSAVEQKLTGEKKEDASTLRSYRMFSNITKAAKGRKRTIYKVGEDHAQHMLTKGWKPGKKVKVYSERDYWTEYVELLTGKPGVSRERAAAVHKRPGPTDDVKG